MFSTEEHANRLKPEKYSQEHFSDQNKIIVSMRRHFLGVLELEFYHMLSVFPDLLLSNWVLRSPHLVKHVSLTRSIDSVQPPIV